MIINKEYVRFKQEEMEDLWDRDILCFTAKEFIKELLDVILVLLESMEVGKCQYINKKEKNNEGKN